MLGVICQERLFQILSLGNKNRKGFYFVFLSLIRIIGMLPKILSLGNKNKKRFLFCIPLAYSYHWHAAENTFARE